MDSMPGFTSLRLPQETQKHRESTENDYLNCPRGYGLDRLAKFKSKKKERRVDVSARRPAISVVLGLCGQRWDAWTQIESISRPNHV
jgi:hypothetical protein